MSSVVLVVVAGVIAYFLGNISPSTIMARANGIDIKKEGSGNAGTTNALRVMGKKAGAITLVVDICKGVAAVLLGTLIAGQLGSVTSCLCVFIGHVWPLIYKFKGGKGVATGFGAMLAIDPLMAVIILAVVVVIVLTTKRMSAGSIVGGIMFPILSHFMAPQFFWVALLMAIILVVKHSANINRLIHGEEPQMSIFVKTDKDAGKEGK